MITSQGGTELMVQSYLMLCLLGRKIFTQPDIYCSTYCRKYLQTGLSLEYRSVCNLFLCKPVDTYNKLLSLYTKKVERSRTFNKIMTSTRYSNTTDYCPNTIVRLLLHGGDP